MKRILSIVALLVFALSLCGCESSKKDRDKLFADLKKADIISNSMEQIDVMTSRQWGLETCTTKNYYVYKDKNSKIILITYDNYKNKKDIDYDHLITIYYDVKINDNINYLSDEYSCSNNLTYKYQNDKISEDRKYEFDSKKTYEARLKKTLLSKKYVFVEK